MSNLITDAEIENIEAILNAPLETDEDYAALAELCEDESIESDT